MVKTVGVLVPTAKPKIKGVPPSPRVHDLNGKVLGLLWNAKPNGDFMLRQMKELISQRFRLAGTEWQEGGHVYGEAEDTPGVKQLAAKADTVLIAIAD